MTENIQKYLNFLKTRKKGKKNLQNRKRRYHEEGAQYFSGKLYIPDDLESLELF